MVKQYKTSSLYNTYQACASNKSKFLYKSIIELPRNKSFGGVVIQVGYDIVGNTSPRKLKAPNNNYARDHLKLINYELRYKK